MATNIIFAVSTSNQRPAYGLFEQHIRGRKRKRENGEHDKELSSQGIHQKPDLIEVEKQVEYSAVITPAERSQRRLAGQPLDLDPPPKPFPHAAAVEDRSGAIWHQTNPHSTKRSSSNSASTSLQRQHVAAVTAVLHQSMMKYDYARARRALSLLLRTESGGHMLDVRSEGLWGVGAEILLRDAPSKAGERKPGIIARGGLYQTKAYYEALNVQFPQHKTWPDVVNAIDFCLAMYGTWIYVTIREAQQLQADLLTDDGPPGAMTEQRAFDWELQQALLIAESMDHRMRDVLFRDQKALVRLRGMVALWVSNLYDTGIELQRDEQGSTTGGEGMGEDQVHLLRDNIQRVSLHSQQRREPAQMESEATQSRDFARTLFEKLDTMKGVDD